MGPQDLLGMTTSTSILLSRRVGSLSLSLVISCGISSENRWSHCAFFSSSSSSKDNKGGGDEGKDPFQWINKQINELKNTDTNALAIKATQLINSESTVQVSYGFLVGYGSGFIMKRITRGTYILTHSFDLHSINRHSLIKYYEMLKSLFIISSAYEGAALLMGGLFVLAQAGADHGYITIDHDKIKKDVEKKLDINQGIILLL